jgi:hypothetical protein
MGTRSAGKGRTRVGGADFTGLTDDQIHAKEIKDQYNLFDRDTESEKAKEFDIFVDENITHKQVTEEHNFHKKVIKLKQIYMYSQEANTGYQWERKRNINNFLRWVLYLDIPDFDKVAELCAKIDYDGLEYIHIKQTFDNAVRAREDINRGLEKYIKYKQAKDIVLTPEFQNFPSRFKKKDILDKTIEKMDSYDNSLSDFAHTVLTALEKAYPVEKHESIWDGRKHD